MTTGQLGIINIEALLNATDGKIRGQLGHDGKRRVYERQYYHREDGDKIEISSNKDFIDSVHLPKKLPLTFPRVCFFGLYAGDGSKGSESSGDGDKVDMTLSFSQKNPAIGMFAVDQVRDIFGDVKARFGVAEDSALFLERERETIEDYRDKLINERSIDSSDLVPDIDLDNLADNLEGQDKKYVRNREAGDAVVSSRKDAIEYLRFWYKHKEVINRYLREEKKQQLQDYDVELLPDDEFESSVRRPFVKGSRDERGGSSRTDDTHFPTLKHYAQLFIHLVEGVEETIQHNEQSKSANDVTWIRWDSPPQESFGFIFNSEEYLNDSPYCSYVTNSEYERRYTQNSREDDHLVIKKYGTSDKWEFRIPIEFEFTPVIAFAAGLYLAEGDTPKERITGGVEMEPYYNEPDSGSKMVLGFNSSSDGPMAIIFAAFKQMLYDFDGEVMNRWKLKVGSAYEPETLAVAEKMGQTLSRRGKKGQGKGPSLAVGKALIPWVTGEIPSLELYKEFFSHIEPTGAGIPRADLSFRNSPNVYMLSIFYCLMFEPDHLDQYMNSSVTQTTLTDGGWNTGGA